MTDNNNNDSKQSTALERLFMIPEGFEEKIKKNNNSPKKAKQSSAKKAMETLTDDAVKDLEKKNTQKKKKNKVEKTIAKDDNKKTRKACSNAITKNKQTLENKPAQKAPNKAPRNCAKKQGKQGKAISKAKTPLKIIPLGGLGEIGKNMTAYEYNNEIIIIDCGLAFPDVDMLGVDLVIPDFTYLVRNKDKVKGLFITHGHEDHIGGIPYLLQNINVPVYATKLAMGLIEGKLREHGLFNTASLHIVEPRQTYSTGQMAVEFIHVNHSFPDSCAVAIHTPVGIVVQTGDFKIDYTPIAGDVIDLRRFGELGDEGVLALLCDSTNAEKEGYSKSERTVGYSFDKLFHEAVGKRIVIATFASNVHRIQQVVDAAVKFKRKIAVFGRSMVNVVQKAIDLGYLKVKDGIFVDIDTMNNYTDGQLVVISTGSQGEPLSALARMSSGEHRQVKITPNDYIIISATPIPGNEKHVGKVINELMRLGAEVIYERMYEIHVSGHACQDEIKTILALTKPRFYMPVHGEYKHLVKNANIAKSMGYPAKNIFVGEIGQVIETDGVTMKKTNIVPSGRVLVDGLGIGDVGSIVLRDRKLLSEEGLLIAVVTVDTNNGDVVSGPELISRGFVYMKDSEELLNDATNVVSRTLDRLYPITTRDINSVKNKIRDDLSDFIFTTTKRKPMIITVIQEI